MDEKLALQYREFYMRCADPDRRYLLSDIRRDFLASGLPYPNTRTLRSITALGKFTGIAFGGLRVDIYSCRETEWCAEHLWHAKRCPFDPWHFYNHWWSGDTDLPKLP